MRVLDYENPWEAVMTVPIREPGWYRVTAWEAVDADDAYAEINGGGGEDLILVTAPGAGVHYQSSQ